MQQLSDRLLSHDEIDCLLHCGSTSVLLKVMQDNRGWTDAMPDQHRGDGGIARDRPLVSRDQNFADFLS